MSTPLEINDELVLEWATPLFIVTFQQTDVLNQSLTDLILRKEREFAKRPKPKKHTPQYWNHFSSFHYRQELFAWRAKAISILRDMITEAVDRFTHRYFGDTELNVTRIAGWANVNRTGDWLGPHNHFAGSQYLSGVYWVCGNHTPLSMFDLDGSLVFLDPRGYGSPARQELIFGPCAGRMVLQPPWLAHLVTPKRSTGLRISIAFDIFVDRNPWWTLKGQLFPNSDSR